VIAWAAARAPSAVSATTSATGSPKYCTLSLASCGLGRAWRSSPLAWKGAWRGAFSCVITSSTPGRARAAAASMPVMPPRPIVAVTIEPNAMRSLRVSPA
jgi:hypothetical protein